MRRIRDTEDPECEPRLATFLLSVGGTYWMLYALVWWPRCGKGIVTRDVSRENRYETMAAVQRERCDLVTVRLFSKLDFTGERAHLHRVCRSTIRYKLWKTRACIVLLLSAVWIYNMPRRSAAIHIYSKRWTMMRRPFLRRRCRRRSRYSQFRILFTWSRDVLIRTKTCERGTGQEEQQQQQKTKKKCQQQWMCGASI